MMRVFALSLCVLHATALVTPQPRVGKVTAQRSPAVAPQPQVGKVTAQRSPAVAAPPRLAALATATMPLACYAAGPAWVEGWAQKCAFPVTLESVSSCPPSDASLIRSAAPSNWHGHRSSVPVFFAFAT